MKKQKSEVFFNVFLYFSQKNWMSQKKVPTFTNLSHQGYITDMNDSNFS